MVVYIDIDISIQIYKSVYMYSMTVCSLRMMTPPLTLTTAMQIAAAYGGDELCAQGATVPPDPYSLD